MTEATVERPAARRAAGTAAVARAYFEALGRRDRRAQLDHWAPDAVGHIHGIFGPSSREGIAGHFAEVFDAVPDFRFEVVELIAENERASVRWRITGTFGGDRPYLGVEPNGAPLDLEGVDLVEVRDGKIVRVDAFTDSMAVANQIGVIPPRESAAGQRLTRVFNRRTRLTRRLLVDDLEEVADGVWLLRGGLPAKTMNVYFLADAGGVTVFDAGIRAMTREVAAAGARLGGIRRVVLGHSHTDHRGTAPGLDAPVLCHPAERADAEGDGGLHYFDCSQLESPVARVLMPRLLRWWDGGPVRIDGTVEEGDEVAGFEVVHLPGHAPGLIGLWRASDRLALASDCVYTLDPQTGRHGAPRVPHRAFNPDHEQARASVRKLAALDPATVWAGHADPVTGDVRSQLERAADEA